MSLKFIATEIAARAKPVKKPVAKKTTAAKPVKVTKRVALDKVKLLNKAKSIIVKSLSAETKKLLGAPTLKTLNIAEDGLAFDVVFPLKFETHYDGGGLAISDLEMLVQDFGKFCTLEGEEFHMGGKIWIVGDGDDASAVRLLPKTINVWLREFPEDAFFDPAQVAAIKARK